MTIDSTAYSPGTTSPQYPVYPADEAAQRVAPLEGVLDSYASNRICVLLPRRRRVWLEPVPVGTDLPSARIPVALQRLLPITYISSWHPHGIAGTLEENIARSVALREQLERTGAVFAPAVTVARAGGWFEDGFVVSGLHLAEVRRLVRRHRQVAAVHITAQEWHVLGANTSVDGARGLAWRVLPNREGTCPVRSLDAPDGLCCAEGAPYVGRSIAMTHAWLEHRRVGTALLGCGRCDDGRGRIFYLGGKVSVTSDVCISIAALRIASRHGGMTDGPFFDHAPRAVGHRLANGRFGWTELPGLPEFDDDEDDEDDDEITDDHAPEGDA